jgi:hypothetical protein
MYICHILRSMLTARYIVALLLTGLILSLFDYELALAQGQPQQQTFLPYNNPNLGVSIQYPSDWQLKERSNDKLNFIKQEGIAAVDLNVENLEQPDTTLSEYSNTRINELRSQRPDFQLIGFEPITISNDKPAQRVVYTFEREEDGKTNKVMRIWTINEGKLYTLAYIAESNQYDRYLPSFQRMIDSFMIDTGGTSPSSSTTQVQSSDRSREGDNGSGNCDRISYPDPDICIPPYPPDLNCPDITYTNFRVTGPDPHGFDRDKDDIGCESTDGGGVTPPDNGDGTPPDGGDGNCDPSYPDICIKSPPPDLNCPDISNKNFKIIGTDPHGFDRDNDGIGCESSESGQPPTICTMEISYGQGPCDEYYIPPDENGQCPEDHRFVDEKTGCVPDEFVPPPCSIDAQGNEVCPPTDELTPEPCPPEVQVNGVCPPTDDLTPVPEPPPPDCPEAGAEVCGEESPPEEPPGPGDNGEDGSDEDDGNGNGNGEDGSNGNGGDNEGGGDIPAVPFG